MDNNLDIEILDYEPPKKKKKVLRKSVISILFIIVIGIAITISMTTKKGIIYSGIKKVLDGLGIYTEELRETSIQSNNYSNPGSFKIDKSFEWVDYKKLKVTYDLTSKIKTGDKYKDVILVLDISGSMQGEKLTKAKEDISELIEYLLEDNHNSIALITFESTSNILSSFSNDKQALLELVNNISVAGCTNYYAALNDVYSLMNSYTKTNDHDIVTVFMTDGYPNENTPSEVTMYQALKQKYPYMEINGIEYEMGNKIIPEVDNITDNIWITNKDNLQNALFEAAVNPDNYETFTIDNYISNYFTTTSSDIKVDRGTASLDDNTINWNLGENLRAGSSAKMEVTLTIKDDYMVNQNYYPLSSKDTITYSLNNNSNTINNTNNLVTKNIYDVKYDVNTPDGCSLSNISTSTSASFTNVTKNQNKLNCTGYLFKGFEVRDLDNSDIKYMNDDVFVMPGHDVELKGVWSRQSVYKTMNGTVKESATLYNVLKEQKGTLTRDYDEDFASLGYTHHDSFDREPTEKVYYYDAENNIAAADQAASTILDSNNVIFANYCWQMIRTTDTGGVKMIYNGPVVDGKCSTDRKNLGDVFEGFNGPDYLRTDSTLYYYGSDYTYDESTRKFQLVNERNDITWANNSNEILENYPYTCAKTSANQQCDTVYFIILEDMRSDFDGRARTIKINSSSHYSQFGSTDFNVSNNTLADMGYMYNKMYKSKRLAYTDYGFLYSVYMNESYSYYYSSTISYNNSTGQYELGPDKEQISWATYKSLLPNSQKRYTCGYYTSCSEVYYVVTNESNYMLTRHISSGELPANPNGTITLSKEITNNGDGTYTIGNSQGTNKIEITRMDLYNNYETYFPNAYYSKGYSAWPEKYYYCKDYSDTCNENDIYYLISSPKSVSGYYGALYIPMRKIKFGSSFKYENGEYTLDGTIYDILNYDKKAEQDKLANAHYTCFNDTGVCQDIYYVYQYFIDGSQYYNSIGLYYIVLSNGKNINQAINEMLYADDVNTYDSMIKKGVDMWFKQKIKQGGTTNKDYSIYLEETIFCNDRSISDFGGWKPDGGSIKNSLRFNNPVNNDFRNLNCSRETDRFSTSVNNTKARLQYSVGLITAPEARLLNDKIRATGKSYWNISPSGFERYFVNYSFVSTDGSTSSAIATAKYGVRPVISLAPGIEYKEGNGSMNTPYVVDTGE